MATSMTERIAGDLAKVHRDLEDAQGAIHLYWLRDGTDEGRNALEALLRAVSTLALAVERLSEKTSEGD